MLENKKEKNELLEIADYIAYNLPKDIIAYDVSKGELSLFIDKNNLIKVISFLKDDNICMFDTISDIFAIDYDTERTVRFELVYNLISKTLNQRVKLRVNIDADDKEAKSISHYLYSANLYEQEIFEGFGIFFSNHNNMDHLYLDNIYDFNPMLKTVKTDKIPEIYFDKKSKIFRIKV